MSISVGHSFEGITFGRAHDQMIEYLEHRCESASTRWVNYQITSFRKEGRHQRFTLTVWWLAQDDRDNRDADAGRAAQEIMKGASKRKNGDDYGPVINLLWRGRVSSKETV